MTKEEKDSKIQDLFDSHQDYFNYSGLILGLNCKFAPKMFHFKKGRVEEGKVIGLFKSELKDNLPIYIVKVNKEYDLEEEGLYLYNVDEHYSTNYEQDDSGRYLVPVSELTQIHYKPVEKNVKIESEDCDLSEMTLKDYAAIHLKKPCSEKEWLNNIIKQ
jgi:hypothetical protein